MGAYDNINGFSYITSNHQHPGDYISPLHTKAKAIGSNHLARIFGNNAATLVGQGYGGYSAYVGYMKVSAGWLKTSSHLRSLIPSFVL